MDSFDKDMEFLTSLALSLIEDTPSRPETIFDSLLELGIDLDSDHKDLQDIDDNEVVDLTQELLSKKADISIPEVDAFGKFLKESKATIIDLSLKDEGEFSSV